jgi:hypothetical protein
LRRAKIISNSSYLSSEDDMPKKMKNPIDEMAKDAKAMGKSINKEIAKDAKAMGTMGKSINKEMAKDAKAVKKSINKALQPKKRRK